MTFASLLLGVLALIGVVIGLLPLLGWLNWINLSLATAGLILGIIGAQKKDREGAGTCLGSLGILANCLALGIAVLRLILGGGII